MKASIRLVCICGSSLTLEDYDDFVAMVRYSKLWIEDHKECKDKNEADKEYVGGNERLD